MTYKFENLVRRVETMYHVVEVTPKSFCLGISTHNVSAINQCCYSVQTQANSLSATQEIPYLLRGAIIHYHAHKRQETGRIFSKKNPINA